MARNYAATDTSIWNDDNWRNLTRSAQWTFQFLWEQPKLSLAGLLEVKTKQWLRACADITADQLAADLQLLEHAGWIAIDHDTDELLIRRFVIRDRTAKNRNSGKGMWNAWRAIESDELRQIALNDMPGEAFNPDWEPPSEPPFRPPSEPPIEPPHPLPHPDPVTNSSSPPDPTTDPQLPLVDNPPSDDVARRVDDVARRVVDLRQRARPPGQPLTHPDRWRQTVLDSLHTDDHGAYWRRLTHLVQLHMPDTPIDLLAHAAEGNPSPNLHHWRTDDHHPMEHAS